MPRSRKGSAKRRAVSAFAAKKHKARAQKRKARFGGVAAFTHTNAEGQQHKPRGGRLG